VDRWGAGAVDFYLGSSRQIQELELGNLPAGLVQSSLNKNMI
jgi:hypothetical protein